MAIRNIRIAVTTASDDAQGLSLIGEVITKCAQYVNAVNAGEAYLIGGGDLSDETYLQLDSARTLSHNALIDSINICNRYLLGKYRSDLPPTGIFTGSMEVLSRPDRRAIGDWAGAVTAAIFMTRQ